MSASGLIKHKTFTGHTAHHIGSFVSTSSGRMRPSAVYAKFLTPDLNSRFGFFRIEDNFCRNLHEHLSDVAQLPAQLQPGDCVGMMSSS